MIALYMNVGDIIGVIGEFLTCEELFKYSRVNTIWKNAFDFHKKNKISIMKINILRAHYCGNLCPCAVSRISQDLEKYFPYYKLKKMICSKINNEHVPDWFNVYGD
jgi:hypothetical protein